MKFRVDQIDHAELTVPNRTEAAKWYEAILGLEVLPEFQFWSDDTNGPLMIGTASGGTKLALFQGCPLGSERAVGFHLVAFRVSGEAFLTFHSQIESLRLVDSNGLFVHRNHWKDHTKAISIYFSDPWGNQLELTTYDHETVRSALKSNKKPIAE